MSIAKRSLSFTGVFESELLLELMLRFWNHPLAGDAEFRNELLERAAEALRAAVAGSQLIEDLHPANVNLVAAIWYAELTSFDQGADDYPAELAPQRQEWLETVRRTLPSCFCNPDLLS